MTAEHSGLSACAAATSTPASTPSVVPAPATASVLRAKSAAFYYDPVLLARQLDELRLFRLKF